MEPSLFAIVAVLGFSGLSARAPITRRKHDRPKLRSGLVKLEGHCGMSSLGSLNTDHVAALLHFGSCVDQEDRLARRAH
jgi:hypothetical protein